MKIQKILAIFIFLAMVFAPFLSYAQQGQGMHEPGTGLENPEMKEENQGTGQGMQNGDDNSRQNRFYNAVQNMEQIADQNPGVGQRLRVLAQDQLKVQGEAEEALQMAESRGRFWKFLVGPDYGQLKTAQDRLENHVQNMDELKQLREEIQSQTAKDDLDQQIQVMEQVKTEMENQIKNAKSGFSLFGWLANLFNK